MLSLKLKNLTKVLAFTALATSSTATLAEGTSFFGEQAKGKWIIGAKVANIDPNIAEIKDSRGVGIVLGYEFDKEILGGRSAFELEYISGEEQRLNINGIGDYEASVLNAFFTYRSAGDVYFKLKGGISYVDIDTSFDFLLDNSFEDTSLAVGAGVGYRFADRGMVELEYTQDSGDSDLGILGLNGLLTF